MFYFMSVDDIIGNLKSSVLQIFTGKQKIKTHSPRDRQWTRLNMIENNRGLWPEKMVTPFIALGFTGSFIFEVGVCSALDL